MKNKKFKNLKNSIMTNENDKKTIQKIKYILSKKSTIFIKMEVKDD